MLSLTQTLFKTGKGRSFTAHSLLLRVDSFITLVILALTFEGEKAAIRKKTNVTPFKSLALFLDSIWTLFAAKKSRLGGMHATRETRRTRDAKEVCPLSLASTRVFC